MQKRYSESRYEGDNQKVVEGHDGEISERYCISPLTIRQKRGGGGGE